MLRFGGSARKPKPPERVGTFHIPIIGLELPQAWRVGHVTFRPAGWSWTQIERDRIARGQPSGLLEERKAQAEGSLNWATAVVRARELDQARARILAALDVLRFFQQTRWRFVDTSWQTFGMRDAVPWDVVDYWVTGRKQGGLGGAKAYGIAAHWGMRREDHRAFYQDQLFAELDSALRVPDDRRSPVQQRSLRCLEVLGADSHAMPPRARILLATAAVEALLDDGLKGDAAHRTIRRAAYLTCGFPPTTPFHGPGRPACLYLVAADTGAVRDRQARQASAGLGAFCSAYEDLRELFDVRNAAAHAGHAPDQKDVGRWRHLVEGVIEAGLRWSVAAAEEPIAALDREVRALPVDP